MRYHQLCAPLRAVQPQGRRITVQFEPRHVGWASCVALLAVYLGACGGSPPLAPQPSDASVGDAAYFDDPFHQDAGVQTSGLVLRPVGGVVAELPGRVIVRFRLETSAGEPVPDLAETNFTVLEDDETPSPFESDQRILVRPSGFNMSLLMLLDLSGSVVSRIDSLQEATQSLVDDLPFGMRIGLYSFDGRAKLQQRLPFTEDRGDVRFSLALLSDYQVVDPSTNLYGAVINGIDVLNTEQSRLAKDETGVGFMVLFTDGTDHAGFQTQAYATNAVTLNRNRPPNYSFFTIGLGREINRTELESLGPDGFVFATDLTRMSDAFTSVGTRLTALANSHYLLSYCTPKRAGIHRIKITATWRDLTGSLTTNYNATGFTSGCVPLGGSALN